MFRNLYAYLFSKGRIYQLLNFNDNFEYPRESSVFLKSRDDFEPGSGHWCITTLNSQRMRQTGTVKLCTWNKFSLSQHYIVSPCFMTWNIQWHGTNFHLVNIKSFPLVLWHEILNDIRENWMVFVVFLLYHRCDFWKYFLDSFPFYILWR